VTIAFSTDAALPMPASNGSAGAVRASALSVDGTSLDRKIGGLLEDVLLLLLAVFLLPLGILLVGLPIALCVRAVLQISSLI